MHANRGLDQPLPIKNRKVIGSIKNTNKIKQISKRRKVRKLPPYLTLPEKDRLFRIIKDVRDRAVFRLLFHHGMRASEIGKLQFSDYRPGARQDTDRILIHRVKGSISGETGVVAAAATAMRAWLAKRGHRPGPLFPSRKRSALSRNRIYELFRRYCQLAEIPPEKAHPHALKHTCCTHLLSYQKESIMDVKAHVGHVDIKSTMVYADLVSEASEARARRLQGWR